jgi:hypothetical protein
MSQHRPRGDLLLGPQLPVELDRQRRPDVALVAKAAGDAQVGKELQHVFQTAAWHADVLRMIFGTGDDARLLIGW